MPPITPDIITGDVWLVVKVFILVGLSLYDVFAFVIVRQVHQMTKTLEVGFEAPVKLFAYAHLLAALGLSIFSLVVL